MFTSLEVPQIQSWKLSNEPMPNALQTPRYRAWIAATEAAMALMDTGLYETVNVEGVRCVRAADGSYSVNAGYAPA